MADQGWELQYLLEGLRVGAQGPNREAACISLVEELSLLDLTWFDSEEMVWRLTDEGRALLALLEVEHCKRRIEAAGWLCADGPYGEVCISRKNCLAWEEFATLEAAAEYAEDYAQGVQE